MVEAATGLALLVAPDLVAGLLLGSELSGPGQILARCFGVALLALALSPAFRGMLLYNVLIAFYLAWLGTAGHTSGALLWPAVGLHGVVALLLVWTRKRALGEVR